MIKCEMCDTFKTSIEMANCRESECIYREPALRGKLRSILSDGKTDPIKPASEMTIRERMALDLACARISNTSMFNKHGANFLAVAQDAVGWADALIERLNGISPPPPGVEKE